MKHLIAPSFSGGRKRWLLLLWLHVFSSRESPSVILFDVPSGPGKALFFFRNGSLAYNIIRNTLGHHLIFLQCDHMRKFVLMRRAQVWLVTLSLSLRVLLSLSVCCVAVSPIRPVFASCSTSSSRVSKTNPAAFSYGTCKHAAYILHLHEWGFPRPVKSTLLNPYRGNNPHQG